MTQRKTTLTSHIVYYVATHDDVTSRELADEYDVRYTSASKTLRRLYEDDILTRQEVKGQGRHYIYNLSAGTETYRDDDA